MRARLQTTIVVALFLAVAGTSGSASACGTLTDWIAKYAAAADDARRVATLQEISPYCSGYVAGESDRALLGMIDDGLRRGLDHAPLQRIFSDFRCLMTARDAPLYDGVRAAMTGAACPTEDDISRWRTVTGRGVNFRAGPSTATPPIGVLQRGQIVEELEAQRDWRRVRTWTGLTGFVHESLIEATRSAR